MVAGLDRILAADFSELLFPRTDFSVLDISLRGDGMDFKLSFRGEGGTGMLMMMVVYVCVCIYNIFVWSMNWESLLLSLSAFWYKERVLCVLEALLEICLSNYLVVQPLSAIDVDLIDTPQLALPVIATQRVFLSL